jgi:predicted transporter
MEATMAEKEVHHHYGGGEGGSSAVGMIAGVVLVALLIIGGIFVFNNWDRGGGVAKGPSVNITTGQK